MKFIVNSSDLLQHLLAVGRVINTKNTLPILDNFLFEVQGEELMITASDLETTLQTKLMLSSSEGNGRIALQAKLLTETLKEFPEQPLTFEIDDNTLSVKILSDKGEFSIMGQNGDEYPALPARDTENICRLTLSPKAFLTGISKTLFATADDELRPVMNGIFMEMSPESVTFVASDAHKLVRYRRLDAHADSEVSFILPKKPASLLKNILAKQKDDVVLEFDNQNAFVTLTDYKMVCRLIEGTYPRYASVIPTNNDNEMTIDRLELHNTLRRVSGFSNPATNLIRMTLRNNELVVSAQDLDYSISAHETIPCEYAGTDLEIGFKSVFLLEILSNMAAAEVVVKLSDGARAGLFLPQEEETADEETLMLLMPMMLNS
ncbi:MAG: DNA polymerase III subunit beta [Flavobacteriaceae bacterium]|nr:DNA polymerase III subunit beta [Flavobacteriaceae bacterium]